MNFLTHLSKIINTGQSRSVILNGNIHDLFPEANNKWVPLVDLLKAKCKVEATANQKGITQIVYEANSAVEIIGEENYKELQVLWQRVHGLGLPLRDILQTTLNDNTQGLEILRQLCELSRLNRSKNNLLIVIESAEMLLPQAQISQMNMHDRKRISIVQDWFKDPKFVDGHDTVILISESCAAIHPRISRLPQVLSIDIPLPDEQDRFQFILNHPASEEYKAKDQSGNTHSSTLASDLCKNTSGLSIHAINQLLRSGDYSLDNVTAKVGEYMVSQLGEGVVEFKRPTHTMDDVIGLSRVKRFMVNELIPGFKGDKSNCIAGALVCGPIGCGKTFICEAAASDMDIPVILLKNIRSKWYGETDEIFEKLRRLVQSFHKIMIFVDEADTQFGSVDAGSQDVEKRLTGSIQAMMSDSSLRGKVIWFLMTARVHALSADIRRPGRMDVIIPILEPEDGDDRNEFINWTFGEQIHGTEQGKKLVDMTRGMSPASYAMIRSRIKAKNCQTLDEMVALVDDIMEPDIKDVRKYQTLQAKLNCTRKSLIYDQIGYSKQFYQTDLQKWAQEIKELEAKGIR
jgi:hypothetical protein